MSAWEEEPTEPGDGGSSVRCQRKRLGPAKPGAHLYLCFDGAAPWLPPLRVSLDNLDEVIVGRGSEAQAIVDQVCEIGRLRILRPDRLISTSHARFFRE